MNILGISAYYHDSAAVLVQDGRIVAAAQEERFSRIKHDHEFPLQAIRYCLAESNINETELDAVTFYDKPILKFARIMETYFSTAPRGLESFLQAIPLWIRQKMWIPYKIEKGLAQCRVGSKQIYFAEHHESHAASSFYPSPFEEAAILTMDGVGEWATSTIAIGRSNKIDMVKELCFPHSLGLLYSAITYFTGFRVNSGEYKLMGLAPYGSPKYVDKIYDRLLDLKEDGSFRLNMKYFGYMHSLRMTTALMEELFDGPPRTPESPITTREMDIAASIQIVTEEIVIRMARHTRKITGMKKLCLSGGVALNCVANGHLLRENIFEDIYIQPASGDAGGALGAALLTWYQIENNPRSTTDHDTMDGAYLGPSFPDKEIEAYLEQNNYVARKFEGADWSREIAKRIADEKVIGLFQGRMEFGPRALGCRSIIGDARSTDMQFTMNRKIKYRESFRPFAPSCLEEKAADYFDIDRPSPYMLIVADVKKERCLVAKGDNSIPFDEQINQLRSDIPAVTHVDYSARIQTVTARTNKGYYDIIKAFYDLTGYAVIINTSFNVRGEPIVCTPEDAYRCFMRTEMDCLVLGSYLLEKTEQPQFDDDENWRDSYKLD